MTSVQPEWATRLTVQQQSVLFLAARGPDGIGKWHPCKEVVRAYRGTVLVAAKFGRVLEWDELGDSFMSLRVFSRDSWDAALIDFFSTHDGLPHHYLCHLYHGAQILGYKHPDGRFRERWMQFYVLGCEDMHVNIETEQQMDDRLSDWDRTEWSK